MKKNQEKFPENEEKKQSGEVSRRDFLVGAGTVVVGGAIGAGLLSSCGDGETKTVTTTVEKTKTVEKTTTIGGDGAVTVTETVGGEAGATVTRTTTVNGESTEPAYEDEEVFVIGHSLGGFSGGGEPNAVYVKNNKIVRISPLHFTMSYTDDEIAPAIWSFEAPDRTTGEMKSFASLKKAVPGRFAVSYKKRVYSPNRVRYPLKRIGWNPGGGTNVNGAGRGVDKFKRITWEEATTICASEINRIVDTYGSNAILLMGDGHSESKVIQGPHGCHTKLLAQIGPATRQIRNPDSWEGWYWGAKHVWGGSGFGNQAITTNLMYDASVNADLAVAEGCDWETTPHGFSGQFMSRLARFWHDINLPVVFICPDLNYHAAVYAYKWIPVLPNTDAAWMLSVIYIWLTEDSYDKDYVDTHVNQENLQEFWDYVLGTSDGVPKTPAWASPITGIPEWTIKAHARKLAKSKTTYIHYWGGSIVRGPYSHEPGRLEPILMGMQGWGGPGVNQIAMSLNMPPTDIAMGFMGYSTGDPSGTMQDQNLPRTMVHTALLGDYSTDNPLEWYASASFSATIADQFKKYRYPIAAEEGGTECHMLWCDNPCRTGCWNGGFDTIDAHRLDKLEFILMQHPWFENDMIYSDLILPSNTMFEEEDILAAGWAANQTVWAALVKQCVQPVGESMGDWDVVVEIAKKLDLAEAITGGEDVATKIRNVYETSALKNMITWEDFNEKKYILAPVQDDWQSLAAGQIAFYTDPEANPLGTPSGKLEFYVPRIAELLPDDNERGPYPKWVVGGSKEDGWAHDETKSGERAKSYPYLLVSNHPRWRMHVQCDDIPWLREIDLNKYVASDNYAYERVWMHPDDAASEGFKQNDIIKLYNERGVTLGAVYITERIMKGAVLQDHGSHVDLIKDRLDRSGCNNLISPSNCTSTNCPGMATSGYLVGVEKVTGEEWQEWREQYPEAFSRAYDPYYGLKFEAWVDTEGGDE